MPEAWERLPEESRAAFEAFKLYLELGARRSILAVHHARSGRIHAKRPTGRLFVWSSLYHWEERAALYDAHVEDIRRAAEEKALAEEAETWAQRRKEIREKGFEISQELLERAKELLEIPLIQKTERTISQDGKTIQITINEPLKASAADAVKFAQAADTLARLAAGLETTRGVVDFDFSQLSDEQIRDIIAGKPVPGLTRKG